MGGSGRLPERLMMRICYFPFVFPYNSLDKIKESLYLQTSLILYQSHENENVCRAVADGIPVDVGANCIGTK